MQRHQVFAAAIWGLAMAGLALPASFDTPLSYTVSGSGRPAIAAADFNGDGQLGLVMALFNHPWSTQLIVEGLSPQRISMATAISIWL